MCVFKMLCYGGRHADPLGYSPLAREAAQSSPIPARGGVFHTSTRGRFVGGAAYVYCIDIAGSVCVVASVILFACRMWPSLSGGASGVGKRSVGSCLEDPPPWLSKNLKKARSPSCLFHLLAVCFGGAEAGGSFNQRKKKTT